MSRGITVLAKMMKKVHKDTVNDDNQILELHPISHTMLRTTE